MSNLGFKFESLNQTFLTPNLKKKIIQTHGRFRNRSCDTKASPIYLVYEFY